MVCIICKSRAILVPITEAAENTKKNLSPLFDAAAALLPPPRIAGKSITIDGLFTPENPTGYFTGRIMDYQDIVFVTAVRWQLDKAENLYRPDTDYSGGIHRQTVMRPPESARKLEDTMLASLITTRDGTTRMSWKTAESIDEHMRDAEKHTLRGVERMDPESAKEFARDIATEPVRLRVAHRDRMDMSAEIILRDFRDIAEITDFERGDNGELASLIKLRNGQTILSPEEPGEIEERRETARIRALSKIATLIRNAGPGLQPQPQEQPQTRPRTGHAYTLED